MYIFHSIDMAHMYLSFCVFFFLLLYNSHISSASHDLDSSSAVLCFVSLLLQLSYILRYFRFGTCVCLFVFESICCLFRWRHSTTCRRGCLRWCCILVGTHNTNVHTHTCIHGAAAGKAKGREKEKYDTRNPPDNVFTWCVFFYFLLLSREILLFCHCPLFVVIAIVFFCLTCNAYLRLSLQHATWFISTRCSM